ESGAVDHHARLGELLVVLAHLGEHSLIRQNACFRRLARLDNHHETHRDSPFSGAAPRRLLWRRRTRLEIDMPVRFSSSPDGPLTARYFCSKVRPAGMKGSCSETPSRSTRTVSHDACGRAYWDWHWFSRHVPRCQRLKTRTAPSTTPRPGKATRRPFR